MGSPSGRLVPDARSHRACAGIRDKAWARLKLRDLRLCQLLPADRRALGRKVSDEFTVPLCRLHHREVHRARNEADWWSRLGIDALGTALKLWKMTRSTNEPAVIAMSEPSAVAAAVGIANPGKSRNQRAQKRAASEPVDTGPQRA